MLWSLDILIGSVMVLVCPSLPGRCGIGMRLQVRVNVFGHDRTAPHEFPVSWEGAEVFVVAFLFWGGELEGFLLAVFEEFGGGEDITRFRDVGAALFVELVRHHFGGEIGDGL